MEYSFVKNGKQPLCVIGDPVAHSLSPAIYNPLIEKYGLNAQYGVMRVPRGDLPRFLAEAAAQGVAGFNATMPHKRDLLALVEGLGPSAQLHGSVNTVVRREGRWIGHSTDGEGFTLSLRRHGLEPSGLRAVLMGAGGAAGAIALQLAQEGVGSLAILNRSVEKAENLAGRVREKTGLFARFASMEAEELAREARGADLLINATPLGMAGCGGDFPSFDFLEDCHCAVCDCIYHPMETALLRAAKERGLQAVGGIGMLIGQGLAAFRLYFGIEPTGEDSALVIRSLREAGHLKEDTL